MIHTICIAAYCVIGAVVAGLLRRTWVLDDSDEDAGGHIVCGVFWPVSVFLAAVWLVIASMRKVLGLTLTPIYRKIRGDA